MHACPPLPKKRAPVPNPLFVSELRGLETGLRGYLRRDIFLDPRVYQSGDPELFHALITAIIVEGTALHTALVKRHPDMATDLMHCRDKRFHKALTSLLSTQSVSLPLSLNQWVGAGYALQKTRAVSGVLSAAREAWRQERKGKR
ncbi:hypothetical protein KIPB_003874 [Kipferlia bialata]|uniref:Uncharacterized protein n=1 Tax=Kipferlia bialata TaxID=797122 RepID=A0A9K3GG54_9EUKA|nr:hypothetical protein KIPB_003874 [Kipferlia bialata]|eukprot:g3874.t1